MTTTQRHSEGIIPFTVTGSPVVGGTGHLIGVLFGIIMADTAVGGLASMDCKPGSVHELPGEATEAFAVGDAVYWDGSILTTTALGNDWVGKATTAKGAVAGNVEFMLTGGKDIQEP